MALLGGEEILDRHPAGLHLLGESPDMRCPSRCPGRGTCRSASARPRRRWSAGRTLAAPISSAGVVLSQPTSSTTPSIGLPRIDSSTSMLARLRNSMAVGRMLRFAQRHHREFERQAAGLIDAALDVLGEAAEMGVAGRQLRPGVADADHRAAVEDVGGNALVLHPAAVHEGVLAVAAEPGLGPQFAFDRPVTIPAPVLTAPVAVLDAAAHVFLGIVDEHQQRLLRASRVAGMQSFRPLRDAAAKSDAARPDCRWRGESSSPVRFRPVPPASRSAHCRSCAGWSGGTKGRAWRSGRRRRPRLPFRPDAALISAICAGVARLAASAADIGSIARRNSNSARTSSALTAAGVAP